MTDKPKAPKSGRWQFSLRTMLVVIAFVAVVSFSMANWGSFSVQMVVDITAYGLLFFGTVAGVFRRGKSQAFWGGFAIVSWGFVILGMTSTRRWPGGFLYHLVHVPGQSTSLSQQDAYVFYPYIMIMLGYLGGLLARYFYSTRADES